MKTESTVDKFARLVDPDARCDECGAYGAYRFDEETLCIDCYSGRCSCCCEFAKGDPISKPTSA